MLATSDLLRRLTEEYQAIADSIVRGNCQTYEDYKAQCARLRTLEQVEMIATGQDRRQEESSDE